MPKTLKQINDMIAELRDKQKYFNENKQNMSAQELIDWEADLYLKLHHVNEDNQRRTDLILDVVKAHHDELPQSVKNILDEYSNSEK